MTSLRREGFPVENISDEKLKDIFYYLIKGDISKEAIPELLKALSKEPEKDVKDVLKELGIRKLSLEELDAIIEQVISKNIELIRIRGERAFKPLMGDVMRIVRGKIDGKTVSERLMKKLKEKIAMLK